jgi:hypothetical protein
MDNSLLQKQLLNTAPLTQEVLDKFSNKEYTSGRKMEVGDQILYGILFTENVKITDLNINFVSFHIDELNVIYELNDNYISDTFQYKLPYLKLIKNGN